MAVCIHDDFCMNPYRCRPHERPGSSGQRSLVAATSQSVRFARSLCYTLRRRTAPFTYMFVRSSDWAGNARARWSLARRSFIAVDTQFKFRRNLVPRYSRYLTQTAEVVHLKRRNTCRSHPSRQTTVFIFTPVVNFKPNDIPFTRSVIYL